MASAFNKEWADGVDRSWWMEERGFFGEVGNRDEEGYAGVKWGGAEGTEKLLW